MTLLHLSVLEPLTYRRSVWKSYSIYQGTGLGRWENQSLYESCSKDIIKRDCVVYENLSEICYINGSRVVTASEGCDWSLIVLSRTVNVSSVNMVQFRLEFSPNDAFDGWGNQDINCRQKLFTDHWSGNIYT